MGVLNLRRVGFIFLMSLGFLSALAAENRVDNVVVTESPDGNSATVVIESVQPLKYKIQQIKNAPVVEIQIEEEISCESEPFHQAGKLLIKEIKFACEKSKNKKGPAELLHSISLILDEKCSVNASQKDWILSIQLKREGNQSSLPSQNLSAYGLPSVEQNLDAGLAYGLDLGTPKMMLPSHPRVDDFIQVGLANNKMIEITQEELKLANRKLFESKRNLFPVVSGRGSQTEGTTQSDPNDAGTRADFKRQEIGLELGQPLFQSGRLYYSVKQASIQKQIAELRLDQVTGESRFEILKALYAFVSSKETLALRKTIQEIGKEIVETTIKKRDIGVASESEYLGVRSLETQIAYKILSHEKDLQMAQVKLISVLNLDTIPSFIQFSMDELAVKYGSQDPKLEDLINLAVANRPEIKTASLNRKVKEYAKKVARAENLAKVDLSAFLGQSGAAFRNEALTMKDSYNLAVKGVLYFGGSSIAPMASSEKTAPDLGSASRTDTRAKTVTVGILDSLPSGSNYLQSKIEEDKALEEYRKNRKEIVIEVKEAFYNFQKAKVQISSAQKELDYRKKEAEIAKAKDRLHQIETPQLLQALSSLTEAEIGIKEAKSFLVTSRAAIDKATNSPVE